MGGPGRRLPAGRRGGPARDLRIAERRAAARLGAPDHRGVGKPRGRRLRRHPVAGLQHRDPGEEEAAGAGLLEGPARPRLQGRGDAGQSQFLGHRLPDARLAGAGVRRGRGVPLHEGVERQRELVRALRDRTDDRGQARRDLPRQLGAARRGQRDRRRLSGQADPALRGRRLRDRLDGDHQGRAQPRGRQALLRLGADRRGAADRPRRQGVRDPDQPRRRAAADGAQSSETRKRLLERWEREINSATR